MQRVDDDILAGASGRSAKEQRIAGCGEMATLIRAQRWEETELGPMEAWSDTLVRTIQLVLGCAFPSLIFWGPEMVQFYNDAFRPLIGEKHPRALGQTAQACWEEAWALIGPQLQSVLERGETVAHEKVLVPILRGGRLEDVWWSYSYSPIFGPGGEIAGILVICQDVTGELVAIRNLKAGEERLRLALAAAGGIGIWDWDLGTNLVYTDAEFARMYSIDPEQAAAGTSPDNFLRRVHPEDTPRVAAAVESALGGVEDFSIEYRVLLPDNSIRWVVASGRCTNDADGKPLRFPGVLLDVTDRKRTEEALRESEGRLRSIYSTSLEYIGILSPEGRILDCNRAALQFAGNTREEVAGIFFWDGPWFAQTPGAPEIVRAAVLRAAAGEPFLTELSVWRPDGELVPFEFSLTPVFDEDGKAIFLVPEARDLTELKRAQRALLESEKIAAVGRLASSIAHEINNPLEAVTNLLYLSRHSAISPKVQEYLLVADHELRRVSAIANQTLRFHKQASKPQAIKAEELFTTVLSIYEGRLRNSNVTVLVRHRAQEPVVCFQGDVRQVLNNLVGNAIDAMPNGGRLYIRSHVETERSSGRKGVVFTVADTGCGMSPQTQRQIYQPFFTTKGIAGTGLGLWVSKEVVERHKGRLRARSREEAPGRGWQGTVFRFFLPLQPEREKTLLAG